MAAKHPELDASGINVHLGHTLPEIAAGLAAGGGLAAAAYLLLRLW
jgi:hypothetical protein